MCARPTRHTGAITAASIPFIASPGPIGSWPCIGRAAIVARVVAAVGPPRSSGPTSFPRIGAALIRGPLGGGKTRFVDEVVLALDAKGRLVRRIVATSATSAVPFGAVAHLLPSGARDSADPLMLIGALRDVLASDSDQRPVLVIDDVPLLDVATAGVIATLAVAGTVHVIASARDDEPLPDPLVDVLLGDGAFGVALGPLSEDDMDTLLHLVLGGPVDGAVLVSMRDRSEGNPLFLRELIRTALDSGALAEVGGVWRLRGDAPTSARLREVVESRLDVVEPSTRPALELLALCDLVDLDELESLVGLEAMVDLESRGLLRLVIRDTRPFATLGHPLHGEAIRMSLPAMRSRLLLRGHVQWVEEHRAVHGADALQLAIWRLDAGLSTDLDSLLHGARLAAVMHDSRSVLRLGRPLFAQRPGAEVGWLVADALFQTGQWAEAFVVLDQASALPGPSQLRVDLAVARATILLWGLGDAASALAVLDALRHDTEMTATDLQRLSAEYASVLVYAGRPADARRELEEAVNSDHLQLQLGAFVSYANSSSMAGKTADALVSVERALALRPAEVVSGVADVDAVYVAKAFALIESGRVAEAIEIAQREYENAVTGGRPLSQFWFMLILGRAHVLAGAAASALRFFTNARALGLDAGLSGPTRSALTGAIMAQALLQNSAAADAAVAECEALPPFDFLPQEQLLAQAWAAVARGDLAGARTRMLDAVAPAIDSGHIANAIWLLHDIARLGRPADVVDQLAELVALTDSPLTAARLGHVQALVAGDLAGLTDAADRFEAMGANLLAAEAAVAASDVARQRGDQRAAAAMTVRAERHATLCEGASTPALVVATGTVDPLTDREREIAYLAASELTSREIADQLFLSYRTVNNHLQHIYDKLGIRGRSELRQSLGLGQE
ncbi:MAG: hypothetical protein JWM34_4343 [Ilumatobacteraceae bacterium]|nr:hypothetical protein [Ilumatobacteraceae bacterium]